jgi:hypothetical protein
MIMDYKVGDEVWYAPPGYALIIKCKIIEVDDQFRKKSPQAYLFYDLDEPVGHYVADDEFYTSFEEVVADFQDEYSNDCPMMTLDEFRKSKIHFIVGTWHDRTAAEKEEDEKELYKNYPAKVLGVDWFNAKNMRKEGA